jgi:hypothetical protein
MGNGSAVKEIVRCLELVQGSGRRASEVFADWLALVELALQSLPRHAESVARTGRLAEDTPEVAETWQRMRRRYDPAPRYRRKKKSVGYFDLFAEVFGILVEAAGTPLQAWDTTSPGIMGPDILGDVYMQYGHPNAWAGQFFTPWNVAKAMAMIAIPDGEAMVHERLKQAATKCEDDPWAQAVLLTGLAVPQEDAAEWFFTRLLPVLAPHADPITICDPCVGSGVMLLAAASQFPPWVLNWGGLVRFYGQDIDAGCVQMCRVNFMLYGLDPTLLKSALALTGAELDALPQPSAAAYREAQAANERGDQTRVAEIAAELRAGAAAQLPLPLLAEVE